MVAPMLLLQGAQSLLAAGSSYYQGRASYKIAQAQADAENAIRTANNEAQAANGNLNRFIQKLNNERAGRNYSKTVSALASNLTALRRDAQNQSMNLGLEEAAARGQLNAAASMSGLTGSVFTQLASTINSNTLRRQNALDIASLTGESNILNDLTTRSTDYLMGSGMDYAQDNLDFRESFNLQPEPSFGRTLLGTMMAQGAPSPATLQALQSVPSWLFSRLSPTSKLVGDNASLAGVAPPNLA